MMKTPPHKKDRDTTATTEHHPFPGMACGCTLVLLLLLNATGSQFSLSIKKKEAPETMYEDEATKLLTDMLTVA